MTLGRSLLGHGRRRPPPHSFTLTTAPGGGPCAKTLGRAPVHARLLGPVEKHQGRRLQPLLGPHRPHRRPAGAEGRRRHPAGRGERQARRASPTARPNEIAAAAGRGRRGREEKPEPARTRAWSASATIRAGTGPDPIQIKGEAYLAGPYKGAPLSLAVMTPAHRRALRPRHRRRPGRPLRRSGDGADPPLLRPDPGRLRRRQAQHPLDRRQRQQAGLHRSTRPAAASSRPRA